MSKAKQAGFARNYPVAMSIDAAIAQHRDFVSSALKRIDRIEISYISAASAGFVTLWAYGPPKRKWKAELDQLAELMR